MSVKNGIMGRRKSIIKRNKNLSYRLMARGRKFSGHVLKIVQGRGTAEVADLSLLTPSRQTRLLFRVARSSSVIIK